ncbi:alkaline phosphatase family protein [Pontiellaceae bacterium B1224]|nr:alkaline phosphatase family protein [Pontiellaceae bacterium B1224]
MSTGKNRVLLIGVDGIGLSDLKKYNLKNFQSGAINGSSGKICNTAALPNAVAWTGLATGCSPDHHGIFGPSTIDQDSGQVRAAGPSDWNRPPVWELLNQHDLTTHRFNIPARHPEAEQEHCLTISPLFFNQIRNGRLSPLRSVQPANFFDATKSLAIPPSQVDRATLELFIPDIENQDAAKHPDISNIAGSIASNLSIQAIAGQAMAELDWNLSIIRFSLADEINAILSKTDESTGLFSSVREATFRTLNLCLGSFRRLAGDHTLILCSMKGDGGGFVAFEGAEIRAGAKLMGPRPEDIAPTLLNLMGLAPTDQMSGRVLEEIFCTPPQTAACRALPDTVKMAPPTRTESGWLLESSELYVAPWRIEMLTNRQKAAAHQDRSQWFKSLPHLLELHVAAPFSLEQALPLCQALFHAGLLKESIQLMKWATKLHPAAPIAPILHALIAYHSGNAEAAIKLMDAHKRDQTVLPDWKQFLVEIYLHLKQSGTALLLLNELLAEHPDHTLALISKSELLTARGQAAKAAEAAQLAVETDFTSERAHLALSRALLLLGRKEEARTAVVSALRCSPESPAALNALATCIEEEDPWGAEMMRVRAASSTPDRQIESRRWQYQLFLQDAQRKMQLGKAHLMHPDEVIHFTEEHPLPLGHLEQTEAIVAGSETALLRKPMLANEPARVEFLQPPAIELFQGVLDRCRRLGIQTLRTWSFQQTGSPLFQTLENHGFKNWMQINQYQINGAAAFEQMKPLVDRIPLPANSTIVPLNDVSWEAVRHFIARHIPVTDDLLGPDGYQHISAELSAVALQHNQIAGVFINRIKDDVLHCPYLAVDPKCRNRWVLPHLFKTVAEAGMECGYTEIEFMTHPAHFPALHALLQRLEPQEEIMFQGLEIAVA